METTQTVAEASPLRTFLWYFTNSQRLLNFEPLKEASLKHWTFKTVCCGILENAGVRSMLGSTKTSDTRQIGPRCLYTPHPAFFSFFQAKESLNSVTQSPFPVRALCYSLDRTSYLRTKNWSFSPSRKAFTETFLLPLSHHGSSTL